MHPLPADGKDHLPHASVIFGLCIEGTGHKKERWRLFCYLGPICGHSGTLVGGLKVRVAVKHGMMGL